MQFAKRAIEEAVVLVGRENERHALADWLKSLTWDGTERLDDLLPRYFGPIDCPILRKLGSW